MNWEINDLFSDLKLLKDRFEDLKDNHGWHFEELYPHEPNHNLNKDELERVLLIMRDVFTIIKCLIYSISI